MSPNKLNPEKRVLITGCGGPLGVNVTRSLKAAPEKLFLVGTEANPYHIHLSLTDRSVLIPHAKSKGEYVTALQGLAEKERITMILPTHPLEVETLAPLQSKFPGIRFFLPDSRAVTCAQSKWETFLLLRDRKLPVPETVLFSAPHEVLNFFNTHAGRPIWVRGAGTPGSGIGVASLPCRTVEHANAWIDYWNGWGKMIGSEYLPGRNLTWCALFFEGELYLSQTRERLEYVLPHVSPSGITGAPAVSRTVRDPKIHALGMSAIGALMNRPHGIFFVDFKEDVSSTPKITEINAGRFGTTIHFYTEAGWNFPYLAVRLAHGEKPEDFPQVDPIPPDYFWIRTLDCGPVLVKEPKI